MTTKRCAWHGCRQEFTPANGQQRYCCRACATKRLEWAKMRGAPLVNALLEERNAEAAMRLALEIRQKLLDEISGSDLEKLRPDG